MNLHIDIVKGLGLRGASRGLMPCRVSLPLSGPLDDGHEGRLGSYRENRAGIALAAGV
jgi:hypothetical protein